MTMTVDITSILSISNAAILMIISMVAVALVSNRTNGENLGLSNIIR